MAAEECKPESYVGCPQPGIDLPDCPGGWEFGNNTAVCATDVPPPLAATGADLPLGFAAAGIVLVLAGVYALLLARHPRRRRERAANARHEWLRKMDAERATLAADRAHYDPENPQR